MERGTALLEGRRTGRREARIWARPARGLSRCCRWPAVRPRRPRQAPPLGAARLSLQVGVPERSGAALLRGRRCRRSVPQRTQARPGGAWIRRRARADGPAQRLDRGRKDEDRLPSSQRDRQGGAAGLRCRHPAADGEGPGQVKEDERRARAPRVGPPLTHSVPQCDALSKPRIAARSSPARGPTACSRSRAITTPCRTRAPQPGCAST